MIRIILWYLAALVAAGLAAFAFGGFYDLSATRQHPFWVYRALVYFRETVVGLDAQDVELPPGFAPAAEPEGAALYEAHCAACHGAPGEPPADFALGMMPVPPPLVGAAPDLPPEEVFWFIRNGLKMSGMPAWDLRMSEADMWRVTAFVEALPSLAPGDYRALVDAAGGGIAAITSVDAERPGHQGDRDRGRVALQVHACRSCHMIPGMVGAKVHVGPSLAEAGARRYIAGILPNTPENMVRWITDPRAVDPLTAMPDLGVPESAARDMAAYLYSVAPRPPSTPAAGSETRGDVAAREDR